MNVSVNGGAVSTATSGGGGSPPLLDFSAPTLLWLCAVPAAFVGLQVLKVGAGPTGVTTLAQAAAA